jgi:hypothetical protein
MRPPIRPFITEHKGRLPKSRASKPLDNGDAENAGRDPALGDPNSLATSPTEQDAAYAAALEAADAIFGGKAVQRPEVNSTSKPSPGRVLPDLLQQKSLASLPATPANRPPRAPQAPEIANPSPLKSENGDAAATSFAPDCGQAASDRTRNRGRNVTSRSQRDKKE